MPRHRHQSSSSQFPVSEPVSAKPKASLPNPSDPMDEIMALLDEEKVEEALQAMETAPKWMQRTPEFALVRATVLMEAGYMDEAGEILRDLERKNPRFMPLYLPLASWYLAQDWPAHALKSVRQIRADAQLMAEAEEDVQALVDGATKMIQFLASTLGLPFEKAEQASWHNEQTQIAVAEENYAEGERAAKEALKIAPEWNSPRNNRAHTLYLLGRCTEAIAEAESALENVPRDIHSLNNLTLFHGGLGHKEQAAAYATQLFELAKEFPADSVEIDTIITALALVEDSEHLYQLAQAYLRKPAETLFEHSWHALAVAAARLGHFKTAKKLLERLGDGEHLKIIGEFRIQVNTALKIGTQRLLWPPLYPGLEILLSEKLMAEWVQLVSKVTDDQPTPGQQRKIEAFLAKYPFILEAFRKMLWAEKLSPAGASALVIANNPAADAEVLRFALSDCGDNESRMHAAMLLSKVGRYSPDGLVNMWDADKDEWNEVQMFSQVIRDVEYDVKPQTADLITKSRRTKNPQEATALLRRAIQDDPTCAMALHNLGVLLTQQGQKEEGEALMRRSVEVDPNYTFGFASLGLMEIQRGNKEVALEHLTRVNQAKAITPETAALSNLAYFLVAIENNDLDMARRHLDTARQFNPEHPSLERYEATLKELEDWNENFGFLRDYQKNSAHRFHLKSLKTPLTNNADLATCLASQTKDTLAGICHFWDIQGYGKKQDLVERLTPHILDQEIFAEIVTKVGIKEREALKWLLDNGGWQPWKEFTRRFGNDFDESPYWQYHEPESIPGRLKMAGLLYAGTLEKQEVAYLPVDVRPLLQKHLA